MSIVQLAKDNYKVRYRVGAKQFLKSGFSTKREARAWEADQLRKIKGGNWTDPKAGQLIVRAVFEDWLLNKQVSARTASDYREVWTACIKQHWGHVPLKDASPADVRRWISALTPSCSIARIRKALTVLSQIFDWAVADERISENPVKKARLLSVGPLVPTTGTPERNRFLNHSEVSRLVDGAGANGTIILVMAYTGLRFGEVTALQGHSVDLLRNRIHVERAFSDVRGRLEVVLPKSGKVRTVPIPRLLNGPLQDQVAVLDSPEDLLFTAPKGGAIRYSRWRRDVFNPAVRSAGLEGLTPHGLRHTYAALAVQAGANPKILQVAMGHSDIRLTLDTYGGLFGDDLDGLALSLDRAAQGKPQTTNVPEMFPLPATRQE